MPFYHVWFSTKYRKWLLQGDVAEKAKEMMLRVAEERGIPLLECETMVDHAHLLLEAGSKTELSWQMKLLKGRSAYEVFRAFPELKLDAGIKSLWQDSFDSRIVPRKNWQSSSTTFALKTSGWRSMNAKRYAVGFNPRYSLTRLRLLRPSPTALEEGHLGYVALSDTIREGVVSNG